MESRGIIKKKKNEIHIWRESLESDETNIRALESLLSQNEIKRANRFLPGKLKYHYIAARGGLRRIISHYAGIRPENVKFRYNSQGKPELIQDDPKNTICFNLSHTDDLVLYAIALNRPVGIDVEKIDRDIDLSGIARRFFSKNEYNAITSLREDRQLEAFYRCWTRKESYIKGKGSGIPMLLDKVEVSLTPGEPAKLLSNSADPDDVKEWIIIDLEIDKPYIGALSYKGRDAEIRYCEF